MPFQCFDVAVWYFEESSWTEKKKRKGLIKHIECSSVSSYLAGVSVNVCGAAEAPEEQAGK